MIALVVLLAGLACAPALPRGDAPAPGPGAPGAPAGTVRERMLVIAVRVEPPTLAGRPLRQEGLGRETTRRAFNADLAIQDNRGTWRPYLAEALPELQTDSWRLQPDGKMETTYQLRPGLVWHDGAPLTAADFVFAWKVYGTPELGQASAPPLTLMEDLQARDERTLIIRWNRPFHGAGTLGDTFPPLPRHILEGDYGSAQWDAFAAHAYWTREHVGLGPYRLTAWEPGAYIEGTAFERHAWGHPRIERLKAVFISDGNAALANLLSGEVHFGGDDSLRFAQGLILKRDWEPRGAGTVLVKADLWRGAYVQLRPTLANPQALLDLRVRRALAHTLNKEALNLGLFEGEGILSDVPHLPPNAPHYAEIERAITRYPFDPRRGEQLMHEAGFSRGPDGGYVAASGGSGRLGFDLRTNASTHNDAEISILASGWREAGFDVRETSVPVAQARDSQARATFPGLYTNSSGLREETLAAHNSAGIPGPENRWTGFNRGGWPATEEFDRLSDAYGAALSRSERTQLIAQLAGIFTRELAAIPLYFEPVPVAHTAALRGPQPTVAEALFAWNIHEWELR
jgi:peptide/nickel transport system substrate-binding protein